MIMYYIQCESFNSVHNNYHNIMYNSSLNLLHGHSNYYYYEVLIIKQEKIAHRQICIITVRKSNQQIVETAVKQIFRPHLYITAQPFLDTGTSIKSGGIVNYQSDVISCSPIQSTDLKGHAINFITFTSDVVIH